MKKFLVIYMSFLALPLMAQNVGINTDTPDNSAVLDMFATDKGLLLPRVSLVNVTNIVTPINAPATGLAVWNTNAAVVGGFGVGLYYFNGTRWIKFQDPNDLDAAYDTGGAGAGRVIIADAGAVRIDGTDGLLVTGAFGSGDLIDVEITGAGTRMFFNPRKAAFRAGAVGDDSWDNSEVGNYSVAFGQNNESKSGRAFAVNFANQVNSNGINGGAFGNTNRSLNNASYSFGTLNFSRGNNSIAIGSSTEANGYDSFSSGNGTVASSQSEAALGTWPRNYSVFNNSDIPFTDSDSQFYVQDRLFVIGNGTSSGARHNAFEVRKDNTITINEEYTLPSADGSVGQSIATDGTGNLSWSSFDKNITQINLFADNSTFLFNNTVNADLGNIIAAFIPSIFNASGNVRIKVLVRYTAKTGNSQLFRLMDHNNNIIIGSGAFTDIGTGTGGVFETAWVNFSGGLTPYELKLNGRVSSGDSVTIKNVIVLVQSQ